MALDEETRQVVPPITSHPTKTLPQILWTVLKHSLYFSITMVLHSNLPIMRMHPPSEEVVIISVELARHPLLVGEAVLEGLVLEDAASVRHSASRQTRQPTVDVQAS